VASGQFQGADTVAYIGSVRQGHPASNTGSQTAKDLERGHAVKTTFDHGYALAIGVGADLPNTVDDALGLAGILQDGERCAYPPSQVQVLTGEAATRTAVLAALDELAQGADEDATVVVYFSGHGYKVSTSMDDIYFLMPYGYDLNNLKTTAIKGAAFADKLRAIPAKKLLVLLDCCHAGGVGEAKAPYIEALSKAPLPPETVQLFSEGSGRVLIASSREDEKSFAGKPYSAFTLALIEALAGKGVSKQDGYVRVADLALHTREMVPQRTNERQHPVLHFEQADNFVLAYYAGGAKAPKGLPFDVEPEIEPEPGAWRGQQGHVSGSGALAQGDNATALGERAVQVEGNVGGDVVTGSKATSFDQRGQTVRGPQTNIAGDVSGPVLSGQFNGPTAVGGGEAVDMRGSQGAVYKPGGPVRQHFGESIRITGDGNVVGDHSRATVIKQNTTGLTQEEFLHLLDRLAQGVSQIDLDAEIEEAVASALAQAQAQARKPKPNASLLLMHLRNVAELLATVDGVLGVGDRLLPWAQQAVTWGKQLFT
jgi:hypothetical protein